MPGAGGGGEGNIGQVGEDGGTWTSVVIVAWGGGGGRYMEGKIIYLQVQ